MKFRDILRFEFTCQWRQLSTCVYPAILFALTFVLTGELAPDYARVDGSFANGPFIVAVMTLLCGTIGLVAVAGLAGDAAARDVCVRMDPIVYAMPVSKSAYLGGRFLAAFAVSAVVLLAVPLSVLLAALVARPPVDLAGPFRPSAYLGASLFLLLPNVFVATALMFSAAALTRRAVASYGGGLLLLGACMVSLRFARTSGYWELGKLLDPLGVAILDELSRIWTPADRSTRLIALSGSLLANRILWIAVAVGALAFTHRRFRLAYHGGAAEERDVRTAERPGSRDDVAVNVVPHPGRTFGFTTQVRQTLAMTRESFHAIVRGWGGPALTATAAFLAYSGTPIVHMGVPLVATTERITAFLAAPLASPEEVNWLIVPLLIVFFAGELIWREREAFLNEIADTSPVPDCALFVGRFAGLSLALVVLQGLLMGAGLLTQVLLGHRDLDVSLYVRTLFGLQLADCVLFGLLALVIHTLVNHKYVGHLVVLTAYAVMAFGPAFGVEHNLLIYGSDPGWTYSDMRGFDPFMGPWRWFKLYWTAWGLLLTVAAVLLSVRGREEGLRARLGLARRRMTRPVAAVAAAALALILAAGGFVFYNTNMLNAYSSSSDAVLSRVEYERRFGQYRDVPQPQLTDIKLHVEIHPRWRMADIRGTFSLVNKGASVIDFIHLTTKSAVDTTNVRFDRSARTVVSDASLGHRIYALDTPLVPGDTLRLVFDVRFEPRGFPNRGIDASVAANGTYFTNDAWLPAIGYQSDRELRSPGVRRAHGLADRPVVPSLTDTAARHDAARGSRVAVEAVVGTDEGQIAVAPGRLRQTWTKDGRRYFQYATDVPIRNDFAFYSAAYAVREGRWNDVSIQILHDPRHAWNVDRLIRSVQASLDYYTKTFGPYPHDQIRFVEHPGDGVVLHAAPINVSYEESFSLLNPDADVRNIDLPFAVAAHEVAHQWWGNMLVPAEVEGAGLLTETLAWYSAMGVVKQAYGAEHLRRLLDMMREVYVTPRTMANVPLLRATDRFLAYRKGPFAIYALSEYIGAEQVNGALKRLVERYGSGTPPLATSLDLYRELQAVTPIELKPLLADLFEANTYWELAADRATAEPTGTGAWQVTLDVRARKVVVDTTGVETERPMDDVVEVGIFGPAEAGETDKPLYLRTHRLRSGAQRITVRVPRQPTRAGIDPRRLLIDVRGDDNVRGIAIR